VKLNTVIAVEISDREGIFYDIMSLCDKNDLNIEYTYSFVEQHSNMAILFLRFETATRRSTCSRKTVTSCLETRKSGRSDRFSRPPGWSLCERNTLFVPTLFQVECYSIRHHSEEPRSKLRSIFHL